MKSILVILNDGKYIIDKDKLIICQSNVSTEILKSIYPRAIVNPLEDWTGGFNVDTGAINRKLGSDMGRAVTGSGLDLSSTKDITAFVLVFPPQDEEDKFQILPYFWL